MAKRNYWRLRRRINRPRDFISSIRSLRFSRQGLSLKRRWSLLHALLHGVAHPGPIDGEARRDGLPHAEGRSEEHTSELQLRGHLVCRLLLEKKKKNNKQA